MRFSNAKNNLCQVEGESRRNHDFLLAFQSLGIVFSDLSISPLYVYRSAFSGLSHYNQNEDLIFGAFSLIFWSLTLLSLLKYIVFTLSLHDNGEGGIFALYSLACRHAKLGLLPNQQAADEELSGYHFEGHTNRNMFFSWFKKFMEQHKKAKRVLLLLVLFSACLSICIGVIAPAISIRSSMEGLQIKAKAVPDRMLVFIVSLMLIGLFVLQHCGTHRVAFLFSPITMMWLVSIASIGIYNILRWNPNVYKALSPCYIYSFLMGTSNAGWYSLGGILLCVAGTDVIFTSLGQFTSSSIRVAYSFVYPCLVLQYMGQAAFFSKNFSLARMSFYYSIPGFFFWPVLVIAILAAVVSSQAVVLGTFSIVKQCHALGCFPRIKIVHKSTWFPRQIYIPEINWIVMILSLSVAAGFHDSVHIGNAYGFACIIIMFVTTCLSSVVIHLVQQKSLMLAVLYLSFFGLVEGGFVSSSLMRIPKGGWVPLLLSLLLLFIMHVWQYCGRKKYLYDMHNKAPVKWILSLGSELGVVVRVPGIGLIYTELASGVPATLSHFLSNLPVFYRVVIFVCVKTVPVPFVLQNQRYLVSRVGPKSFQIYRCTVRNGYKDVRDNDNDAGLENDVVMSIAEFIEADNSRSRETRSSGGGSSSSSKRSASSKFNGNDSSSSPMIAAGSSRPPALLQLQQQQLMLRSEPQKERRRATEGSDLTVSDELLELIDAKNAGTACIIGHSRIKAKWDSSFFKRLLVNIIYSFLRKNCRSPAVCLAVPHVSLIEVGINYYL